MFPINQRVNQIENLTVAGPISKTQHHNQNIGHVKSKSFMHNDEFVSASADNSQLHH